MTDLADEIYAIERQAAHDKIDEIYDALESIQTNNGTKFHVERIQLRTWDEDISGTVLIRRLDREENRQYVSWDLAPYGNGLVHGHYDMDRIYAIDDWASRTGW
ncbi:hypothetical protein [uncultured Halomonas sp.]|uniref:hypothetical protein n=1 Tax=uncultured Halomonas sp. TaxID=173971 RepID=UPI00261F38AC|nr:hypothetical protein [uncultured Halomonas sp.]